MRRRCGLLGAAVAVLVLTVGCADRSFPSGPYDHDVRDETSVAVPVSRGGEVGEVVTNLEEAGFFCAEVRANRESAQVWCRIAIDPDGNALEREVTVVNMIATRRGALQYADVEAPAGLIDVLDVSFLSLWPGDSSRIKRAIVHNQRGSWWRPNDPRPERRNTVDTAHARYVLDGRGGGLHFSLTTSEVQDQSWPISGNHYATTFAVALPALELGGFHCYAGSSPCYIGDDSPNQFFRYSTEDLYAVTDNADQILAVEMFIPGSDAEDAVDLAAVGFPEGLQFLTTATRGPIEQQIMATRRTGEPFTGIVAGTVVVIEPPLSLVFDPGEDRPVTVTIGVDPISSTYSY